MLTFEDFKPGHFGTFGPRHVTREEIIAFAREYDPQPMHLDEEAANRSMLRGLSGSGWHMCALMMRMLVDGFIGSSSSLGAPGVEESRWLSPLRPGDNLMLDVEVLETRVMRSRPDVGLVKFRYTLSNAGEKRLTMTTNAMFRLKAAATDAGA
jgi:acyl dehydratase